MSGDDYTPTLLTDENGADRSAEARRIRHGVEAEVLSLLRRYDDAREVEGAALDEANRHETKGELFTIFDRWLSSPDARAAVLGDRDTLREKVADVLGSLIWENAQIERTADAVLALLFDPAPPALDPRPGYEQDRSKYPGEEVE